MTQNVPLRFAALLLCTAVLTGTLAACRGNTDQQTTTTATTAATTTTNASTEATLPDVGANDGTGMAPGSGTGSGMAPGSGTSMAPGANGTMNGSGTGTASGIDGSGSGGSGSSDSGVLGSMFDGEEELSRASFRFNGALYRISADEQLRRDEIGRQLMLIENTVDEPGKDGDAVGLPRGTRIHAIRDNADYTSLAVEYGGMLYRANRIAE